MLPCQRCCGVAVAHRAVVFSTCTNPRRQFDLAESRPAPVLRTIWDNLLAAEERGDPLAGHIRR